jgi:hypothetical protein
VDSEFRLQQTDFTPDEKSKITDCDMALGQLRDERRLQVALFKGEQLVK